MVEVIAVGILSGLLYFALTFLFAGLGFSESQQVLSEWSNAAQYTAANPSVLGQVVAIFVLAIILAAGTLAIHNFLIAAADPRMAAGKFPKLGWAGIVAAVIVVGWYFLFP